MGGHPAESRDNFASSLNFNHILYFINNNNNVPGTHFYPAMRL